jgi:hypothetical protein
MFARYIAVDVTTRLFGRNQVQTWRTAFTVFYLTVIMAQLGQLPTIRHKLPYFHDLVVMCRCADTLFAIQCHIIFA